jgi:hypothetical protein
MTANGKVVSTSEIAFYKWQHLAVVIAYVPESHTTTVNFYNDAVSAGSGSFSGIVIDYPDHARQHLIGSAWTVDQEHCEYIRGYMWSFAAYNFELSAQDLSGFVSNTCNGCGVCPIGQDCLSDCGWHSYWSEGKCERCPTWCPEGCLTGGMC